jgi:hypothetical protein
MDRVPNIETSNLQVVLAEISLEDMGFSANPVLNPVLSKISTL